MSYYLAEEAETNAKTSVAATPHYFPESPFGETIVATGPLAKENPFRFSTKYTDDESGLLYYGYRYYSPSLGRWLARDPVNAIMLNLYGYVDNDPMDFVDTDGRAKKIVVPIWECKGSGVRTCIKPFRDPDPCRMCNNKTGPAQGYGHGHDDAMANTRANANGSISQCDAGCTDMGVGVYVTCGPADIERSP